MKSPTSWAGALLTRRSIAPAALVMAAACTGASPSASFPQCDEGDAGLLLPEGFCAAVFADDVGPARHLAVRSDGAIFVALNQTREEPGGIVALQDTTGDGRADVVLRFGDRGGTGIELVQDTLLYLGTNDAVLRYRVPPGALAPAGAPDPIVTGLPTGRSHRAKSIAIDGDDLYVNHGAPSNSCQLQDRQPRSPGQDPCPELETRGGIWRFDATRSGQTFPDGERYATGTRNVVALTARADGQLYGVQHGRDQLAASWGFDEEYSARNPGEEMLRIDEGDDFGWPYCYWSTELDRKVLAPEYGGDGEQVGRCASAEDPVVVFPGHWAPNGVVFYTGQAFPERYRDGAFVAFHGSWNRAPLPQAGYNVAFVPFQDGRTTGEYEVFAEGFTGAESVRSPDQADHRPSGVAVGPDGALYVSDDEGGRIYRVLYEGSP